MREEPTTVRLSLPESHYAAIGKVAVTWTTYERLVESSLWILSDVSDDSGLCLTSQIPNMARRFDALISLAIYRKINDELIKKLKKLSEHSQSLGIRRNRVIHDGWNWNITTQTALRLEMSAQKNGLAHGFVAMHEEEVLKLVKDIVELIDRFDKTINEAFSVMSPLPSTRT